MKRLKVVLAVQQDDGDVTIMSGYAHQIDQERTFDDHVITGSAFGTRIRFDVPTGSMGTTTTINWGADGNVEDFREIHEAVGQLAPYEQEHYR